MWDGPLGKTVAGSHPELFEEIAVSAHISKTHYARSMRTAAVKYEELTCVAPVNPPSQQALLTIQPQQVRSAATTCDFIKWWRWDSIGAACEPRCGGCRCGNCQPGGKEMTLAEERELEVVKSGLTYVTSDDHSEKPHWHARYPWIEDPVMLPNNRRAVEMTFRRTEKQLAKEAEWKAAYAAQIHDMVDRRAAMKLSEEALLTWSGPTWRDESAGKLEEEVTPRAVVLPNQLKDEDNKALGLGYTVEDDKFHIMVRINFSKRKKKMRLGQDLLLGQVRAQTPEPLTQRELLSQVSGLYDPIGLATPLKQRGAILVRRAFQEAKPKGSTNKETWDLALSDKLREDAIDLFEDYVRLSKVKFARALTPVGISAEPIAITFSDGSEHAYGAVLYLWWPCNHGSTVRLVESKAKLTPLDHKGEAVKAELCGAVFAARLKKYFEQHGRIQVKQWYHFIDSQTVLGAIQRESYGFQTFFANRIGEIQGSTRIQDWWWVPGPLNIADIMTRGAGPKDLEEDSDWQQGPKFLSLPVNRLVVYKEQESGLLVCGGRVQSFKEDRVGVPLLPYDAWISTLLAREAHNMGHEGVAATLLKMRKKAWVIKGRKIAQKVVDSCIICKKVRARRCQQVMGNLPPERTRPAAPFEFTAVDLFGPYQVRDDVKKRVTMKVWGVVFCCMASRAIHTELVNTMSTESFLMAYQRFTAIRGHPKKIWSDPGTNFIGTKPVLEELYQFLNGLDRSAVGEVAARNGTDWQWKVQPADSPHRNGAAEAAVRIVKKALQSLGSESGLTYSEFQTMLQLAANLANERPIDARVQSREDSVQYITPNALLLGRASLSGDFKSFDFIKYPYKRLREMQCQVNRFWRSWSQFAGPNLFVRNKWHTLQRNVAVGDIVWLCDQNALRGQFKLGRVVNVNPDSRGVVRDVNVKIVPSYCGSIIQSVTKPEVRPVKSVASKHPTFKVQKDFQSIILHRDVRRLVVLLPVEEQAGGPGKGP
ncbi:gag-pol fusion poly [Labeo rohita]|uniref:Gag-pol fusion poly n=1 Tax=Labeo rohita TaxID=84645 RepID=A0A498M1F9_LABRO|nr:gag-pol fusion poly [Labeo rohita]